MENSDNDKHVSVHFVRCLKCGKILKCSRFDTAALLRHIETDHPELVVSSKSAPDNNMPSNAQESTSREPLPSTDENNQQNQPQTVLNRRKGNMGEGSYPPSSEQSPSPNEKDPDPKQTHYIIKSEKFETVNTEKKANDETKNNDKGLSNIIYTRRYKINTPKNKKTLYRTSIEKWRPVNGTIYCPNCGQTKRPLIRTRAERLTYNSCGACCLLGCWPFCFLPCLFPVHNLEYLHCANCKTFLGLYDRDCNCIKPNRHFVAGYDGSESSAAEQTIASDVDKGVYLTKESKSTTEAEEVEPIQKQNETIPKAEDNLPSIVINGRPLDRDTVTKIKKLSRFSTLAGINLKHLTETPPAQSTTYPTQDIRLQSSTVRSIHHTSDSSAINIKDNAISTQGSASSNSNHYNLPNNQQKNLPHSDPIYRKKNCNNSKTRLTK